MIETTRCRLESPRVQDRLALCRVYTDSSIRLYLGGPVSFEEANRRVDNLLASTSTELTWVIRRKDDGAVLGTVSLGRHHDGTDTEVSYALFPEFQNVGYGIESVSAVVTYAFETLRLPRVVAETQTANSASCHLLERLEMSIDRKVVRFGAEQSIYSISFITWGNRTHKPEHLSRSVP